MNSQDPTQRPTGLTPVPTPAPAAASVPTPATAAVPVPMQVPDNIAGVLPLPLWKAEDYQLLATGDSAAKLASSAVAPLVAAARGYTHISEATTATARGAGVDGLTGKVGSRFRKLVGQDGAMHMPWYRPSVARREPVGHPGASAHQFRPVNPLFSELSGKVAKYEFLAGQKTVLDIHPATPGGWLDHSAFALITEGILKGDAGLTGMLRSAGITDDELRYDDETVDALPALRALMKRIPEADRTMILSFGGVANWHSHPEWNDMNLKHRTVLIAFDGDLESNANVYKQGAALWQKLEHMGATPKLLNLNVVTATARGAEARKYGLDDYLAAVGPWESLTDRILDALPEAPAGDDSDGFHAGDWRMNEEICQAEVLRVTRSDDGSSTKTWDRTPTAIIGRISKTLSLRVATDEETATGVLAEDSEAESDNTVEVETTWLEDNEDTRTATITGPDTMLADMPAIWASRSGGRVPLSVLIHPNWAPPPEWLVGMKRHRRVDMISSTQWGHMGWVPVKDSAPVFIVGKQVLNRNGDNCKAATPGVTEHALAMATKFGVISPTSDEQLKSALLKVWSTYRDGVWSDPRVAALVLAAGLRPVVPLPCRSAILISGGKRLGKSWSAAAVMSFWQKRPGTWTNDALPGSAEDTMAATENALARTPIWVVDDWAPVSDPRKAAADSTKLGAITRAIHNHTGKRRATRTMGAQEVLLPRALLIITAEHEHTVGSVSDRLIHVPIVAGSLGGVENTERVVQMWTTTGEPAVVTGGAIAQLAAAPDWAQAYRDWAGEHTGIKAEARRIMSGGGEPDGDHTRHIKMAADLALGLKMWQVMFERFGLDDEAEQALDAMEDLFSLCRDHMINQKETTPGAALVKALRATLAAGHAHINSVDTPGAPPISNALNSGLINSRLGWRNAPEGARGGGEAIGDLVYLPNGSTEDAVVILHQTNAFQVAKKHHPDLILAGSQPAATWSSMWSEKFCSDQWARKKSGARALLPVVRVMVNRIPLEGVPVKMSVLLGLDLTEEERREGSSS